METLWLIMSDDLLRYVEKKAKDQGISAAEYVVNLIRKDRIAFDSNLTEIQV
jgi:hypothetical protein